MGHNYDNVFSLICTIYRVILRQYLIQLIDDPDSEFDDRIMALLDRIFCYPGEFKSEPSKVE